MYNLESQALYIRLWRHSPYVDYFIIVFSNKTHSGLPKTLSFEPYTKEIEQFKDKIRIVYADPDKCLPLYRRRNNFVWCRENTQRDAGVEYIEQNFNPTEDDLILLSDCDEIFTRQGLEYIIQHPPELFYFVHGIFLYPYYFHTTGDWDMGAVIRYHPTPRPSQIRAWAHGHKGILLAERNITFVTHCSYCFDNIDQYLFKLKSYAHQEYNRKPYTTYDHIFKDRYCRRMVNGKEEDGSDLPIEDLKDLMPPDKRLRNLYDPSFEFDITKTKYTKESLTTLCKINFTHQEFDYPSLHSKG